jgi:hypothetical protein
MDFHQRGFVLALAQVPHKTPSFSLSLPVAFFIFGISDLIETQTGAWWEPWWLLLIKTLCVFVFLFNAIRYQQRKADRREL